jgi:hypothetical protein
MAMFASEWEAPGTQAGSTGENPHGQPPNRDRHRDLTRDSPDEPSLAGKEPVLEKSAPERRPPGFFKRNSLKPLATCLRSVILRARE